MIETTLISLGRLAFQLGWIAALLLGLGRAAVGLLGFGSLAGYWRLGLAAVAGAAVVNLAVQAAMLAGWVSRLGFQILGMVLLAGAMMAWGLLRPRLRESLRGGWQAWRPQAAVMAAPLLAIATNLIIAAAPSTKIDELYYHMLAPKRLLEDRALVAYLEPFPASALPQMQFQYSQALAHAWGQPDAGNLASMVLSLALAAWLYGFCRETTGSRPVALLLASAVPVGLYAAVHHTSSGPHALGDLAVALAAVAMLQTERLAGRVGAWRAVASGALCAAVGASTKLSLWPLAALITLIMAWRLHRRGSRMAIVLAAIAPWLICQGPMLALSWRLTGSPFGPFFFGQVFGAGPPAELAAEIANSRIVNQGGPLAALRDLVVNVPPVVPLAALALLWPRRGGFTARGWLLGLVAVQLALIGIALPHHFRFLSGLIFAVVAAAAMHWAGSPAIEWLERHSRLACLVSLGGWLGAQLFYAAPFAKVFTGVVGRQEFIGRYVALAADFRALDTVLPANAVLLTEGRLPALYAPRAVVFTWRDLHGRPPVYYLAQGEGKRETGPLACETGIYSNPNAVVMTFRNPLRAPVRGAVRVYRCRWREERP